MQHYELICKAPLPTGEFPFAIGILHRQTSPAWYCGFIRSYAGRWSGSDDLNRSHFATLEEALDGFLVLKEKYGAV